MWSLERARAVYQQPFLELLWRAQSATRENFAPNTVQASTLLSIKTGGCPEDCAYCSQSAHYDTGLTKQALMAVDEVVAAARAAKAAGASRFCLSAAWRGPREGDLDTVCAMIEQVRGLGLETCATLGLLGNGQAEQLKSAGLDYYNHNIDTAPERYNEIISTRNFSDRLATLDRVRGADLKVCCGGIVGMGETIDDRLTMLMTLANLETPPESVPINRLIPIPGTPLEDKPAVDPFDFIKLIATARLMMPRSYVRLSAGRDGMSDEMQALCFMAGANSIFLGDKLLTAANAAPPRDAALLDKLGLSTEAPPAPPNPHAGTAQPQVAAQ